jgi:hypothetical protein
VTTPGNAGRFDGYDVLSLASHWDQVTSGVVLRRLGPPAPLRYFTQAEGGTARALLDRLLGQDQPGGSTPYVDVLADVDSRLALEVTDGWHYADMPHDGLAWRNSLRHLDEDSRHRFGSAFRELDAMRQQAVVQGVQDLFGNVWHNLPAKQVWSLWTRYACAAFYAHPWAWNEIGFGGPAYPRGYKHIGLDRREPWERQERDARDPVPWAERVEAARRQHVAAMGCEVRTDGGCAG